MKERDYQFHDGKTGAAITVRVTPRASHNEISEILSDGTIKICLTAVGSEEKANQILLVFLADVLQVKPSQLEIVAGLSGNDKLITITNLDKSVVQERLLRNLS